MRAIFRYPGGKARLAPFIERYVIPSHVQNFIEPFAGGASVSLTMLQARKMQRILLCEANPKIAQFWKAVFNPTSRAKLIADVLAITPTVDSYYKLKERDDPAAVLAINRMSHSGRGGGPIGGKDQTGNWKIDARWNPERLAHDIEAIGQLGDGVVEVMDDGFDTLGAVDYFAYIDPPYISAGPQLYAYNFTTDDHARLAVILNDRRSWALTYDDHPLIRDLYGNKKITELSVLGAHPVGGGRKKRELLITSDDLFI